LELGRWRALVLLEMEGFDGMAMEVGRDSFIYGEKTCSRGQDLSIRVS